MSESGGEIEYLDEDEEIVQQCVQSALKESLSDDEKPLEFRREKRKAPYEQDSDYNPKDVEKGKRRRLGKRASAVPLAVPAKIETKPNNVIRGLPEYRKKVDIKIPDFENPLCLPVKLLKRDELDVMRLRSWNNMCLEHIKQTDTCLKPKSGDGVASKRTVVLRNVIHKHTGAKEVSIWSKTSVENAEGEKKSEVFSSILPRYRERNIFNYVLHNVKRRKGTRVSSSVLLSRERERGQPLLVAYKPQEAVLATFRTTETLECPAGAEAAPRRLLREAAAARACASCYQQARRSAAPHAHGRSIACPACARAFPSVYNLLAHARTHDAATVRRARADYSRLLAKILQYHYKCRICQRQLRTIRELRRHVATAHLGPDKFLCEIGNHIAQ